MKALEYLKNDIREIILEDRDKDLILKAKEMLEIH